VDMAVVGKVHRQVAQAQKKLVPIVKKLVQEAGPLYGWTDKPNGRVDVKRGNSAYWGCCSYTTVKEGPVATVEAHFPYEGVGGRAEVLDIVPTVTEIGRKIGLPIQGGKVKRLTIWNPPVEFLKRSMEHNPRGTVMVALYYSIEGYGGIGSGFYAVLPDGTWKVGAHG